MEALDLSPKDGGSREVLAYNLGPAATRRLINTDLAPLLTDAFRIALMRRAFKHLVLAAGELDRVVKEIEREAKHSKRCVIKHQARCNKAYFRLAVAWERESREGRQRTDVCTDIFPSFAQEWASFYNGYKTDFLDLADRIRELPHTGLTAATNGSETFDCKALIKQYLIRVAIKSRQIKKHIRDTVSSLEEARGHLATNLSEVVDRIA